MNAIRMRRSVPSTHRGDKDYKVARDIATIVKGLDWKPDNVHEASQDQRLFIGVAPSMANLFAARLKDLDEKMEAMISQAISEIPTERLSWESIVAAFGRLPYILPEGTEVVRKSALTRDRVNKWKFDGSAEPMLKQDARTWFEDELLGDNDVVKSVQLDAAEMAVIYAQTGATINTIHAIVGKREYHEKKVIEIGILRYPDVVCPRIKLYRIKLFAWSECERIVFHQHDNNGLIGEFKVRNYVVST